MSSATGAAASGAYGRNPFPRAKDEAPYTPHQTWLTAGLRLGLDESDAAVQRDGAIIDRWHETVGDDDPVWILGGVGDPAWLTGLPGRLYVVAGYGDPPWVGELEPDMRERRREEGADPVEHERARRCQPYLDAGVRRVITGYGYHLDDKRGVIHPKHRSHVMLRAGLGVTSLSSDTHDDGPDGGRRIIGARAVEIDDHDLRPVKLEDA